MQNKLKHLQIQCTTRSQPNVAVIMVRVLIPILLWHIFQNYKDVHGEEADYQLANIH